MKYCLVIALSVGLILPARAIGGASPEPGSERSSPSQPGMESATGPSQFDEVLAELAALRAQLEMLQQTLDIYLGGIVNDLQMENDRLRDQIRNLYLLRAREPLTLTPTTPPPYRVPVGPGPTSPAEGSSAREELTAVEDSPLPERASSPDPEALAEGLAYTVVSTWGRTPDEAASLGEDVASLKGMVCVVAPNPEPEALLALGRELRFAFDDYENINIEVFDDVEAARLFVERNADPSWRRVMTISRHRRSGRDLILLVDGNNVREVPWEQ